VGETGLGTDGTPSSFIGWWNCSLLRSALTISHGYRTIS